MYTSQVGPKCAPFILPKTDRAHFETILNTVFYDQNHTRRFFFEEIIKHGVTCQPICLPLTH